MRGDRPTEGGRRNVVERELVVDACKTRKNRIPNIAFTISHVENKWHDGNLKPK